MMKAESQIRGVLATSAVYAIFGLNLVFCKDLTRSGFISPVVLLSIRAICAACLFWLLSTLLPKEKIAKQDRWKLIPASLLGILIPNLSSLVGITMSTPFDSSLINSLKPLLTLLVAALILKEKITFKSLACIFVSLAGAVLLVVASGKTPSAGTSLPGLLVLLLNGVSFAFYIVLFRPLIKRYSVVTFMKWMFLISALASIPMALPFLSEVQWAMLNARMWGELAFLVLCATFIAYFLTPIGQKNLHPVKYSLLSYVQPVVAAAVSIAVGMDVMTLQKAAATLLIAGGVLVYLVGKETT